MRRGGRGRRQRSSRGCCRCFCSARGSAVEEKGRGGSGEDRGSHRGGGGGGEGWWRRREGSSRKGGFLLGSLVQRGGDGGCSLICFPFAGGRRQRNGWVALLLDASAERFNGPASCNCSLGQGRTGPSSWTLTSHLKKTYSLPPYYLSQIQMSSTEMCLDISVFVKCNINWSEYYFFR
jgi:hypothetical protein